MANDPSRNLPGTESEPAAPSQTPSERLYLANGEYLPWGAVIPGMGGTRVGDEIVDDVGNRWNWEINDWDYAGSTTEKPETEPDPTSPFPTVNYLQDPTALLMNPSGEPAAPGAPSFQPQAAPPAVRLDQPQTIFGPVTPSGYAIPPVDPMSYYAEPAAPVQTPSTPGIKPPVQPPAPEPVAPPAVEPGTHFGPKPLDFGDPFFDNEGNQWIWDENNPEWGYWKFRNPQTPATPPIVNPPPQTGGEPVVTPPRESIALPPEAVTTVPVQKIPTVTEQQQLFPEVVTINRPTFPIYEPAPSRGPVTIPGTAVSSRPVLQPVEPIAQVAPTTVPVPTRQDMSFSPGRFDYINYDPEEILAAAMRAMSNSRIRQSITDEAVQNRMFSRMR